VTGSVPLGMEPKRSVSEMFSNASSYESYMGRWSAKLAPLFAKFAGIRDGERLLDVGCGTGALIQTVVALTRPREVVGIDPVPGFITYARQRFTGAGIAFDRASAFELPYSEGSFDRALSMLVFHLIAAPDKALREMRRVTKAGGTVAACTWDGAGAMELSRIFWTEAIKLDPAAEAHAERTRSCNLEGQLSELWKTAGLKDVQETAIDIRMDFISFDDYWLPYLGGVGPTGAYVASLSDEARNTLREQLRNRVLSGKSDGAFALAARAWAVRGLV
jgi:SAM-dependent methyltransferase